MNGDMITFIRVGGHTHPVPERATEGSAGFDLRTMHRVLLHPGEQALVKTGWVWEIPEGWVGLIRDRSGMANKHRITTRAGVIDSDYRGEVMVVLCNERPAGAPPFVIPEGERFAQMIVVPFFHHATAEKITMSDTARGAGGFGHTGKE